MALCGFTLDMEEIADANQLADFLISVSNVSSLKIINLNWPLLSQALTILTLGDGIKFDNLSSLDLSQNQITAEMLSEMDKHFFFKNQKP